MISWKKEHLSLLEKMEIAFDYLGEMTDGQSIELVEIVGDYFAMHGLAGNGDITNEIGELCADILTLIAQSEV